MLAAHRVHGRPDRHVHHIADQHEHTEPRPGGGDVHVGGEQVTTHVHGPVQPEFLLRRAGNNENVADVWPDHRRH